jgi:predicted outer membrane lipoprotein
VIVLGLLLAAAVVVLVALPFLREPVVTDDRLDAPSDADEQWFALVEERDRALAALKELEFDHRTGKVNDADYRELVGPLRQAAAVALRALDRPQE